LRTATDEAYDALRVSANQRDAVENGVGNSSLPCPAREARPIGGGVKTKNHPSPLGGQQRPERASGENAAPAEPLSRPASDMRSCLDVRYLSLALLDEAPWNAIRIPRALLEKIRRSISEFGVVENLVARPQPGQPDRFEVISGNHRLRLFRELGLVVAPVVVVELDDARARLLAQTLNRTRGSDDPQAYSSPVAGGATASNS